MVRTPCFQWGAARVPSLVGELRSRKPRGKAKRARGQVRRGVSLPKVEWPTVGPVPRGEGR